ncbi:hypothetical protein MAR_007238 [Mya arenaria]|uniref:Secreted protein n=1 Tax=Mya arenaria TaxID=6604 RepID=A0ABY7DAU0_MYAAR|nr:hypothetical protein MAR_007238 [Mya arenaria]
MTLLCFILITCCGLSVVNGDEVAEKAVREYRELCPLTTLCPSRSKTTPTPTTTRTTLLDERTDCYIFFQPPEDLTAGVDVDVSLVPKDKF